MTWLELHDPPVELHSGGLSRYRVNAGDLYAMPAVLEAVFECWAAYLNAHHITKYRLVPIPMGGVAWAEGFMRYTGKPDYTAHVVIVDDVLTTGASITKTREMVGKPDATALVVVNRGASFWQTCAWMSAKLPMVEP